MKIVFFNTYNQSFLSSFFLELSDELSFQGHEVTIICLKNRQQTIKRPSGVSVLIYKRKRKLINYLTIFQLIKSHRPNVVVSNFSYVNPAVLSSKLLGVKHNIIWFHTLKSQMNFTLRQITIKSQFMKMASAIITNSEELKQEVIESYGQRNKNIITIPFTTSIHTIEAEAINFERVPGYIYLGCPGRIDNDKNQILLLELLYLLNDPRYIVVFAGRNDFDILKKHQYFERFNSQLIFLGNLSKEQMVTFFNDMDVVILPSLNEAFGLVLIEALASGTKTLVSQRFGALEYITESIDDMVFNPTDAKQLSKKLSDILSNSKSKQDYKDIYFNFFSKEKIVKQFLTLID